FQAEDGIRDRNVTGVQTGALPISIVTLLSYNLEKAGHETDVAFDENEAVTMAMTHPYDLIILDLMLPGMDGLQVCKTLRQNKINTPILILTAKEDELDKILDRKSVV